MIDIKARFQHIFLINSSPSGLALLVHNEDITQEFNIKTLNLKKNK